MIDGASLRRGSSGGDYAGFCHPNEMICLRQRSVPPFSTVRDLFCFAVSHESDPGTLPTNLVTMTFSIVGRCEEGSSWGVAVASKFLAAGALVPAARAGVGALATQANANVAWKSAGLRLLAGGLTAPTVVQQLVDGDEERADRQLGVVDATGGSATHTGSQCLPWAGGVAMPGVAIQGNILAGPAVVDAMSQAWSDNPALPLAQRLLTATAPPAAERISITPELAAELDSRARAFGRSDFAAWVGAQNYEMRVADDGSWIDRRVLDIIRSG
jgi:Family of unknown function (DUF1028)